MQHQFNRFLAFPLLLVAVSLPLRWGHSHEGMYGQHLSQHLKLFHSPLQNQTLPSGWHSHALFPGMVLKEHDHLFVLNELYENDFYSHVVNEHTDLETFDPGMHEFLLFNLLEHHHPEIRAYADRSTQIFLCLQILLI